MHQSLPVVKTLAWIVPHLSASCVVCEHAEEDHFHLFHECPLAGATWTRFLPSSVGFMAQNLSHRGGTG